MKSILFSTVILFFFTSKIVSGQVSINKVKFFEDTSVLNATIETNMVQVFRHKQKTGAKFPASFSATLPDSTKVDVPIFLK